MASLSKARGAAGHEVERIDVETLTIEPCTNALLERKGEDVTDGMAKVRASLLKADAVVLATPLYYYGMTAQLKAVVDRFVSRNDEVAAKGLEGGSARRRRWPRAGSDGALFPPSSARSAGTPGGRTRVRSSARGSRCAL